MDKDAPLLPNQSFPGDSDYSCKLCFDLRMRTPFFFQECLRPDDLYDAGRVFVLLDTVGRLGNAMSTLAILLALRVGVAKIYLLSKFQVTFTS